jgi:hypothetical protein
VVLTKLLKSPTAIENERHRLKRRSLKGYSSSVEFSPMLKFFLFLYRQIKECKDDFPGLLCLEEKSVIRLSAVIVFWRTFATWFFT